MKYFENFPLVLYSFDGTVNSASLLTNIFTRVEFLQSILTNYSVYYTYNMQDHDTFESIAYKYYGDPYRYWIVLFANQIIDPQWQWPMNNVVFNNYLAKKYPDTNIYSTIHSYQKTITQVDNSTNVTTKNIIVIDESTYNSLITGTHTYYLPTGSVTITTTKEAISIYSYENDLNESKRHIKLINSIYANSMENQLEDLMKL
mgnify:CR=1 FL=1